MTISCYGTGGPFAGRAGWEQVGQAVSGIHEVVAELRELSSSTMSSRLSEQGLAAAVGDLVRRIPLPVHVDIPTLTVPAPVEETAYFVIAGALANAVKHGAADHVEVRVADTARPVGTEPVGTELVGTEVVDTELHISELVITVRDNGIGGVDPRLGTGLRGLQERVHAVGGRLVVSDVRPHGTLVEAVLPCAS